MRGIRCASGAGRWWGVDSHFKEPTPSLRGALATKQSILSSCGGMDCFASLAMTQMVWRHTLLSFPRMRESSTPRLLGLSLTSLAYRVPAFARTTLNVRPHSRDALRPSFASILRPQIQRAQGMPDARCTRGLMRIVVESARMSIQGSGEHPTFPAQWLYGL